MTTFLDALTVETSYTRTQNGAKAHKSTLDPVVDFFSRAGAMRQNPQGAADLFDAAFEEDPTAALRTLFYLRDIRGGQGERAIFRECLRRYAIGKPGSSVDLLDQVSSFKRNLALIPEFGRWDDLFFNGVTEPVVEIIREQLRADLKALNADEPVSLLAKWLPSENASSKARKALARQLATELGYSYREYRRVLSRLRACIRLLEQDMSSNNWNEIDFGKLPSQAHRRHVKAFFRHTPERYQGYLDSVTKGEAKINVSTVYPYEIFNMVTAGSSAWSMQFNNNQYANVAWENLPDYTNGRSALVMADTSGSMMKPQQPNNPIAVSVSLALYFAERNTGAFAGHFMTFSESPNLVKIRGNNLAERMANITASDWGYNTDMLKAFRAILAASLRANEAPPAVLYIISDMEFDRAGTAHSGTIFETAKREFTAAGLKLPHVVFWNVDAKTSQSPATVLDGDVTLVSGLSPSVFGMAVEGKSPRELVDSVINSARYEGITA